MFLNKKILCLIPARGGSKGIKDKNLKKINNKSLVKITIQFAEQLKFLDNIVLSSDSIKILHETKKTSCNQYKRPKKLSGDRVSDYKLIKDILASYNKFDYLLYLQPTSPFRTKKDIIFALRRIINENAHGIWSVTNVNKKFHPKKILKIKKKKYLEPYMKEGKKIIARQQLDKIFIRNGIFYIFSIKELRKQKTIYLKETLFHEINYKYYNIDDLSDLTNSRKLFKEWKFN